MRCSEDRMIKRYSEAGSLCPHPGCTDPCSVIEIDCSATCLTCGSHWIVTPYTNERHDPWGVPLA